MNKLEQLCYMWSEVGLEERTGFQVRAASPGFTPRENGTAATALRLCRYSAPNESSDRKPVSYGWIDGHDVRFLFRRVDAGTDAFGRSGAFVAHVAAGPPAELTPEFITQRFNSRFWLSGDERLGDSTVLPAVGVREVPAGPPALAERALLVRFCAALISARLGSQRLVITTTDSELVASLMAGAAQLLPTAALDDLAFSTYETAETASLFDVVGMSNPDELPSPYEIFDPSHRDQDDGPELRLAQALCGSSDRPTKAATASLGAADTFGGFEYRVALDAHEFLLELDEEHQMSVPRILTYLRKPSMTSMIVLHKVAAKALGDDLRKLGSKSWYALAASAQRLTPFELRPLAEALRTRSSGTVAPLTDDAAVVAIAASILDDQALPTAEREQLIRAVAAVDREGFAKLLSAWLIKRLGSRSQGPPPPGLVPHYCILLASAIVARVQEDRPLLSLDEQSVLSLLHRRHHGSTWTGVVSDAGEIRSLHSTSLRALASKIVTMTDARLREAAGEYLADRMVCVCVRRADVDTVASILADLGLAETPGAQGHRMLLAALRPGNGAIQPAGLAVLKWIGGHVGEALPVERHQLTDRPLQTLAERVFHLLPPNSAKSLERAAAQHSRQAKKWVKGLSR